MKKSKGRTFSFHAGVVVQSYVSFAPRHSTFVGTAERFTSYYGTDIHFDGVYRICVRPDFDTIGETWRLRI